MKKEDASMANISLTEIISLLNYTWIDITEISSDLNQYIYLYIYIYILTASG